MSKRCELQKEYYQQYGNYKGNGKYCDKYVSWLENEVLALRQPPVSGSLVSPNAIQKEAEKYQKTTANKMSIERTAFAQGALWVRSLFLPNDR